MGLDLVSVGVALRAVGKGGKAQSMFPGRSGDGWLKSRGIGLVALLVILYGDLGALFGDNEERLFESL